MPTTDLLAPDQVAKLLGVTRKRLAEWRSQGIGPEFLKLGHRTVRYHVEDLDTWLEAHRRRGPKVGS